MELNEILVIAMLIFPGATGSLLSDRLPVILGLTVVLSFIYSLLGLHLAIWPDCSTAGAMVVAAGLVFLLVWILSPRKGLISRWLVVHRIHGPQDMATQVVD